jgi:hypothetical protein
LIIYFYCVGSHDIEGDNKDEMESLFPIYGSQKEYIVSYDICVFNFLGLGIFVFFCV